MKIIEKGINDIRLIKPLWEQLNLLHLEKSVNFKKRFETYKFEKRMEGVVKKSKTGEIKLYILYDDENNRYAGYCLSSIENGSGEIESLFIEEDYRKYGFGGKFMKNTLKWFEDSKVTDIKINVVYNNNDVLAFYERYGFKIGNYILKKN
ncbi:GNAT family N-acetyltransferase [uncultured Clostridium sp.]|uniref:GNAT family N-acetyltransferase n=1 Tax=uncultured Clostridium sp. TaxID=59620 RepID=UPI0025F48417|nr:GNAT family N-acetyltransferase [uncultured Clostridium sp.]